VANVNTVKRTSEAAYQAKYVVASAVPGGPHGVGRGAQITEVQLGNAEGTLVYDPKHPLADAEGMVRFPDMSMSDQMTNLIIAQRAYQANVTVFERARDAYLRALEIGK
jgi:flagellar basal-body rod protein FlgC